MKKFKPGQRVKVVAIVTKEKGWDSLWIECMDSCYGGTFTVLQQDSFGVFMAELGPQGCAFPPRSLKKVKDKVKPGVVQEEL